MRRLIPLFFALILLPTAVFGQGTNLNARIAGLEQDVAALNRQLGAIRIEMEGLIRENRALRESLTSQNASQRQQYVTLNQLQDALRNLETQFTTQSNRQRDAMLTTVSAEISKLAEQTQTAISALARSIESRPSIPQVVTFSDNHPKTGVNYTVRPGDSLGKIAREQKSTVQWIRDANRLASDLIYPNQELFIPQQN